MENGLVNIKNGPCLETVRALHQTVVALRAALEQSRNEILELKSKSWPTDTLENAIKTLSIENHLLKNQLTNSKEQVNNNNNNNCGKIVPKRRLKSAKKITLESSILINKKKKTKISTSFENLINKSSTTDKLENLKIGKSISITNCSLNKMTDENYENTNNITDKVRNENDMDQDQEVDDIELIFTTDDTKDSDFKEQLVSIDDNLLQCPVSDVDDCVCSDRELDDDVFNNDSNPDLKRENSQLCNSKSDNSINQEEKSLKSCYSFQDSSFENKSIEKDESFDRFDEKIRIIETDISKCGIQDSSDYSNLRRNTCPNPLQYRPLLHREALKYVNSRRAPRPILAHSNAIRKESGAQTDISALPGSAWLSESNLSNNNNKIRLSEIFPTLPSKFPLPGSRLRLSEKTTVEARRVLLSDIGFTSMVPELSRSADHLFGNNIQQKPVVTYGQFLKTTDFHSPCYTSQKFTWTTTTASPSECSYSQSRFNSMYPLLSPPVSSRRCSAPVSPSKRAILKPTPSKVRFANGSLPELRGDWSFIDSGDSTDSLVEEAENYLRRSIDCIISNTEQIKYGDIKRTGMRRASAPEPASDNIPPQGWLPFLPRLPRDLRPDYWVKVITPEGRVRGGRVRYIGPLMGQNDQFVGVQLSTPDGNCDGTYNSRKYFQCESYHGIFVPFKKVIMGWRP